MHVDEDAAHGTLGDATLVSNELGMLAGDQSGHDLSESAKLLVGITRFDRNVDVNAGRTGCLEIRLQLEFVELFQQRLGDSYVHREFGAVRGIEIEEEIVGMLEILIPAGPGVVVDAAEARQKEQ